MTAPALVDAFNAALAAKLASLGIPAEMVATALTGVEDTLAALAEPELQALGAKINGPVWRAVEQKEGQEFAWLRPLIDPTVEKFVTAFAGPKPAT